MSTSEHWDIAGMLYPSEPVHKYEKDSEGRWHCTFAPEPIATLIHPKSDLTSMMKSKDDYPKLMHHAVDKWNYQYLGSVRLALSREETDWQFRTHVMEKTREAAYWFTLYEHTDGFTKEWHSHNMGFIPNEHS